MTYKKCFTIIFLGYLIIGLLFAIPFMFLNVLGYVPITINGVPRYGWVALLYPIVYLPFMSAVFAFFNAIFFMVGKKVYERLNKSKDVK